MADLLTHKSELAAQSRYSERSLRKVAAPMGMVIIGGVPIFLGAPIIWGAVLGVLGLFLGRAYLPPLVRGWLADDLPVVVNGIFGASFCLGLLGWLQAMTGFRIASDTFIILLLTNLFLPPLINRLYRGKNQ